ncbi:hypothetical protein HSX37_18065|uniref:Putative ABC-transporter type IV n=1 Tax=Dendrosporobacter quercicolus TaxID=146817 RepID=A0A1G9X8I7_9FIRM|nr:hypothetical protein [Dendrosporobacter quercicolus DSM 1736]SDM92643.1 Putative ABC-transporter type IV [Dendrosporobacter quercicolus]
MRRVIIYGLIGWCLEIVWTGLGSLLSGDIRLTAQTYLWMFPIYGLAAVLFEPLHDAIRLWPLGARGGVWMLLCFTVEYLSGWMLRSAIGAAPWDYSAAVFHIHGLIRLDYAPAWFGAGLLFERLHDWLDSNRIYRS